MACNAAGKKVSQSSLESASGAISIRAEQEKEAITGQQIYVNIDMVSENGVVGHNFDRTLTIRAEGAELPGFGISNPKTDRRVYHLLWPQSGRPAPPE